MAGGTWLSQNKTRPGAYINFKAVPKSKMTVGDRGIVAICLPLSWGKNGNQGIDPYGTLSTVSSGSSGGYFYTFGNSGTPSYAIRQSVLGNALLGWETTESWNFGFESSWIDNRISVDLDVYFSKTYDQIFNRSILITMDFLILFILQNFVDI